MATFTTYTDNLPDPVFLYTDAGTNAVGGSAGPGFSAIGLQSNTDTQVSRTVSGRGVSRDTGTHFWSFNISYNPMFRAEFDPVAAFLIGRNPRRNPFYVVLPQYSKPKMTTFAAYIVGKTIAVADAGGVVAGRDYFTISTALGLTTGTPQPMDMFTITDANDFNHQKVYTIKSIETNALYQAGTTQPAVNTIRIHFAPPLQRFTSQNAVVNFINPMFRVISKSDVQEYQLNTEGLYSFSLTCEEFQP